MLDRRPRSPGADGGGSANGLNKALDAHVQRVRNLAWGEFRLSDAARMHASAGVAQKRAVIDGITNQTIQGFLLYGLRKNNTRDAPALLGMKDPPQQPWELNVQRVAELTSTWVDEAWSRSGNVEEAAKALAAFNRDDQRHLIRLLARKSPLRCAAFVAQLSAGLREAVRLDPGEHWIHRAGALGNRADTERLFGEEIGAEQWRDAALTAGGMSPDRRREIFRGLDDDVRLQLRAAAAELGWKNGVVEALDKLPPPQWLVDLQERLRICAWEAAAEGLGQEDPRRAAIAVRFLRGDALALAGLAMGAGLGADELTGAGEAEVASRAGLLGALRALDGGTKKQVQTAMGRLLDWRTATDAEERLQAIGHFRDDHLVLLVRGYGLESEENESRVAEMVRAAETVRPAEPHRSRFRSLVRRRPDPDGLARWLRFGSPMMFSLALQQRANDDDVGFTFTLEELNDLEQMEVLRSPTLQLRDWYERVATIARKERLVRVLKGLDRIGYVVQAPIALPLEPVPGAKPDGNKRSLAVPKHLLRPLRFRYITVEEIALELEPQQSGTVQSGTSSGSLGPLLPRGTGNWGKIKLGRFSFGCEVQYIPEPKFQLAASFDIYAGINWEFSWEISVEFEVDRSGSLPIKVACKGLTCVATRKFARGESLLGSILEEATQVSLKISFGVDKAMLLKDAGVRAALATGRRVALAGARLALRAIPVVIIAAVLGTIISLPFTSSPIDNSAAMKRWAEYALRSWCIRFLAVIFPPPLRLPSGFDAPMRPGPGYEPEPAEVWAAEATRFQDIIGAAAEDAAKQLLDACVLVIVDRRLRRPVRGQATLPAAVKDEVLARLRAIGDALPEQIGLEDTYREPMEVQFSAWLVAACKAKGIRGPSELTGDSAAQGRLYRELFLRFLSAAEGQREATP